MGIIKPDTYVIMSIRIHSYILETRNEKAENIGTSFEIMILPYKSESI